MTDRPRAAIVKRREDRRARAWRRLRETLHRGSGRDLDRALEFCRQGRFSNAREVMSPEQLVGSLLSNGVRVETVVDWMRSVRHPNRIAVAGAIEDLWYNPSSPEARTVWVANQRRRAPPFFTDPLPHSELVDELERLRKPLGRPPTETSLGELHEDVRADHAELVEMVDEEGLHEARRQLLEMLRAGGLDARAERRARYLLEYCAQVVLQYTGRLECTLANGATATMLWHRSHYETRYNTDGRLYSLGNAVLQKDEHGTPKPRSVDIAGTPRALRPFFLQRVAHDLDQRNSQAMLLLQMGDMLVPDVDISELRAYVDDRKALFDEVCETYGFGHLDAEARKELVKPLVLRLMFSGSLKGWQLANDINPRTAPPCARIARLEEQLRALRRAIFAHPTWATWVADDRARQTENQLRRPPANRKSAEDIERSVFARIAQSQENVVLTAMRRHLVRHGFRTLALVFDGCVVLHKPVAPDLQLMSADIKAETGYDMGVDEKPMYAGPTAPWPTLSLDA